MRVRVLNRYEYGLEFEFNALEVKIIYDVEFEQLQTEIKISDDETATFAYREWDVICHKPEKPCNPSDEVCR